MKLKEKIKNDFKNGEFLGSPIPFWIAAIIFIWMAIDAYYFYKI